MTVFEYSHVFLYCQSEESQCCVYWPTKDQPMSFEGFTVSYSGEEHLCLPSDERLLVQDFTMESKLVNTHTHAHTKRKQYFQFCVL